MSLRPGADRGSGRRHGSVRGSTSASASSSPLQRGSRAPGGQSSRGSQKASSNSSPQSVSIHVESDDSMKQALDKREAAQAQLLRESIVLQWKNSQQAQKLNKLMRDNQELKAQLEDAKTEKEQVQRDRASPGQIDVVNQLQDQLRETEENNSALQQEKDELLAQVEAAQRRADEAEAKLGSPTEAQQTIGDLHDQLAARDRDLLTMREELENASRAASRQDQLIAEQNEELERKNARIQDLQNQLDESFKHQDELLSRHRGADGADSSFEALEGQARRLRAALQESEQEAERQRQAAAEARARVAELQEQVLQAKDDAVKAKLDAASAKEQAANELLARSGAPDQRLADAFREAAEAKSDLDAAEARIKVLEAQLQRYKEHGIEDVGALGALQDENDRLELQVRRLEERLRCLHETEREAAELQEQVASLRNKLQRQDRLIEAERDLGALQPLDNAVADPNMLQRRVSALESELSMLKTQAAQGSDIRADLRLQLQQALREAAEARAERDLSEEKYKKARSGKSLPDVSSSLRKDNSKLRRRLQEMAQEADRARDQRNDAKRDAAVATALLSAAQKRVKRLLNAINAASVIPYEEDEKGTETKPVGANRAVASEAQRRVKHMLPHLPMRSVGEQAGSGNTGEQGTSMNDAKLDKVDALTASPLAEQIDHDRLTTEDAVDAIAAAEQLSQRVGQQQRIIDELEAELENLSKQAAEAQARADALEGDARSNYATQTTLLAAEDKCKRLQGALDTAVADNDALRQHMKGMASEAGIESGPDSAVDSAVARAGVDITNSVAEGTEDDLVHYRRLTAVLRIKLAAATSAARTAKIDLEHAQHDATNAADEFEIRIAAAEATIDQQRQHIERLKKRLADAESNSTASEALQSVLADRSRQDAECEALRDNAVSSAADAAKNKRLAEKSGVEAAALKAQLDAMKDQAKENDKRYANLARNMDAADDLSKQFLLAMDEIDQLSQELADAKAELADLRARQAHQIAHKAGTGGRSDPIAPYLASVAETFPSLSKSSKSDAGSETVDKPASENDELVLRVQELEAMHKHDTDLLDSAQGRLDRTLKRLTAAEDLIAKQADANVTDDNAKDKLVGDALADRDELEARVAELEAALADAHLRHAAHVAAHVGPESGDTDNFVTAKSGAFDTDVAPADARILGRRAPQAGSEDLTAASNAGAVGGSLRGGPGRRVSRSSRGSRGSIDAYPGSEWTSRHPGARRASSSGSQGADAPRTRRRSTFVDWEGDRLDSDPAAAASGDIDHSDPEHTAALLVKRAGELAGEPSSTSSGQPTLVGSEADDATRRRRGEDRPSTSEGRDADAAKAKELLALSQAVQQQQAKLSDALDDSEKDNARLKDRVRELENLLRLARDVAENHEADMADADRKIAYLDQKLADAGDELKKLRSELADKNDENDRLRQRIKELEDEVDRLKRALAKLLGKEPEDITPALVQSILDGTTTLDDVVPAQRRAGGDSFDSVHSQPRRMSAQHAIYDTRGDQSPLHRGSMDSAALEPISESNTRTASRRDSKIERMILGGSIQGGGVPAASVPRHAGSQFSVDHDPESGSADVSSSHSQRRMSTQPQSGFGGPQAGHRGSIGTFDSPYLPATSMDRPSVGSSAMEPQTMTVSGSVGGEMSGAPVASGSRGHAGSGPHAGDRTYSRAAPKSHRESFDGYASGPMRRQSEQYRLGDQPAAKARLSDSAQGYLPAEPKQQDGRQSSGSRRPSNLSRVSGSVDGELLPTGGDGIDGPSARDASRQVPRGDSQHRRQQPLTLSDVAPLDSDEGSSTPTEPSPYPYHAIAMLDYDPRDPGPAGLLPYRPESDELPLTEGEPVTVLQPPRPDGLCEVKIGPRRGLVPAAFLKEMSSPDESTKPKAVKRMGSSRSNRVDQTRDRSGRTPRDGPTVDSMSDSSRAETPVQNGRGVAKPMKARYDFDPEPFEDDTTNDQYLPMRLGDTVYVSPDAVPRSDGFVEAETPEGVRGLVPREFLGPAVQQVVPVQASGTPYQHALGGRFRPEEHRRHRQAAAPGAEPPSSPEDQPPAPRQDAARATPTSSPMANSRFVLDRSIDRDMLQKERKRSGISSLFKKKGQRYVVNE